MHLGRHGEGMTHSKFPLYTAAVCSTFGVLSFVLGLLLALTPATSVGTVTTLNASVGASHSAETVTAGVKVDGEVIRVDLPEADSEVPAVGSTMLVHQDGGSWTMVTSTPLSQASAYLNQVTGDIGHSEQSALLAAGGCVLLLLGLYLAGYGSVPISTSDACLRRINF